MPIYEYKCRSCGKDFEELRDIEHRDGATCPDCDNLADRKMSLFRWKWDNIFTRDGEGFTSVQYSKEEAKERARANAGKYD